MARPHSPFGIASLVTALAVGAGMVATVALAALAPPGAPNAATAVGLLVCGFMGLNLLGAALGVVGLMQKDRSPTLSAAGASLNALTLLGVCVLMFFGVVLR